MNLGRLAETEEAKRIMAACEGVRMFVNRVLEDMTGSGSESCRLLAIGLITCPSAQQSEPANFAMPVAGTKARRSKLVYVCLVLKRY